MAGSEGLDYKCIRQVHIMDPWYNMSRIEQIIGRAVRTCSHKNLPFEKRNVEIYLYGSLLRGEEKTQKEAVDLYVYRLAELKAVKIGNVSRVLKEISVDCILNYEQAAFTIENMQQEVELELPSKNKKKIQYAIGDKPYSATCDYKDNCNYVCRPAKTITDVKMDTYNEYFITNNIDKIIQKIKALMKAKFFYHKKAMIVQINLVKIYPLVQINAALDYLVEDKYEYITDKYGRLGNLINIDDLYLFQPLEIKNKHISLYDRSTPIHIKRENLAFKLPKNLEETVIHNSKKILVVQASEAAASEAAATEALVAPAPLAPQAPPKDKKLVILLKKLEEMYLNATKRDVAVHRGEEDWYQICSTVIQSLETDKVSEREQLLDFVVEHMLDELTMEEMLLLLRNLALLRQENIFEQRLKKTIEKNILKVGSNDDMLLTGILVNNNGENVLLVQGGTDWKVAEPLDINDFKPVIDERKTQFLPAADKMNSLVGFISIFKKEEGHTVFKVKDLSKKRNKGARCDQSGKEEALNNLNSIIAPEHKHYTAKEKIINRKQVCVMQEMFLRMYNAETKNGKVWFLSTVLSNLLSIEKL